ncbi:MAG: DNA replication/repair protein RecF [Cryobacterium sp.]|nr:DNA replication/repair protein RecF [Cryobacterium sp.]MBX3089691.1 DNA replication/repair protein RecF [Cryobacterium sp.]MCO5294964.1 DNA replication/repair protein RecF [Homoserinimonas sp.]
MMISRIELTDFRNYSTAQLEFEAGPTLLVGSNGQGKTNLVEAINYLGTLGSHRASTVQALIRQGSDFSIIRAMLRVEDRTNLVEIQLNRSGPNKARVNGNEVRTRELPRYSSSIVFAPEDLSLIRGEPSSRRRFLDELLTLRNPRFSSVFADYDRVLRQRNSLLKSSRGRIPSGGESTLEIWDEKLISLGTEIILARIALIEQLQPEISAAYLAVAGSAHSVRLEPQLSLLADDPDGEATALPGFAVFSPAEVESRFAGRLAELRKSELERGVTLVGPHRDDLLIELNGMPARGYSSHGESWSLALSLRLSSARLLKTESRIGDPILILDDVFAELDERRRERLSESISDFEQILVTAAVARDVPKSLAARKISIEAGTILNPPATEAGD